MNMPTYIHWVTNIVNQMPSIRIKQSQVIDMVVQAIKLFKEYESPRYYSGKGRKIKRPQQGHSSAKGRYNQKDARTILISGLTRAWALGTGAKATISNKNYPDSPFVMFATDIFRLLNIGNIHKHLEEYTSIRKANSTINNSIKDLDFTD